MFKEFILEKLIQRWWLRSLIFLGISVILFLPFLIKGQAILWRDSQFHISRLHELLLEQQTGQLFPDIIRYSGVQNWGYGLNFFYPTFLFYPLIFIWRITDLPITSIVIFNILVVYFALYSNFSILYKITSKIKTSFIFSITYILTAGIGIATSWNIPIVRIEYMTQYTSNMAILIAPVIILSFYNIIFLNDKSTWVRASIFSSLSLMLSIPTTLGIVLTILVMCITALVKKRLNSSKIIKLLLCFLLILALSSAFLFPFLEQRLANHWANLPSNPDLFGLSFSSVFNQIFDLSDILSVLVAILSGMLIFYKKFTKTHKILVLSYIASLIFLYSSLFPWYFVNPFLSGALQMTYRWNFIPAILGSLFVALATIELSKIKKKIVPILCFSLLYLSINGMLINTVAKHFHVNNADLNTSTNHLVPPTKDTINTDSLFSVNNSNVKIILDQPNLALGDYRAKGQYEKYRNIYLGSLVTFENRSFPNKTSVNGKDFYISNIPNNTKKIQAPITYLKGFSAYDENGTKLKSYRDSAGFLSILPQNAKTIKIIYTKTKLHQLSIIIFSLSWILLAIWGIIYLMKGIKREKTIHHRTSL
ncbi:MFS transporter permease [Lactococcus lactis subsp. lactis]|nr:MFS transporter permease [Lactococcus lactis subsp. lactis]